MAWSSDSYSAAFFFYYPVALQSMSVWLMRLIYITTKISLQAGNHHEVGVSPSDPTRPVYTVIVTHQTAVQFTWLDYSEDVSGAHFDVPLNCASPSKPSALPGMVNPFRLGVPKPFHHFN